MASKFDAAASLRGSSPEGQFYQGLGNHFVAGFIQHLKPNTLAAFAICFGFETDSFGEVGLGKPFPRKRELHEERLKSNRGEISSNKQQKRGLLEEKKGLHAEQEIFEIEGENEGNAPRRLEILQRLRGIEIELTIINRQISRLSPKYRPHYDDKSLQWRGKPLAAEEADWQTLQNWAEKRLREPYQAEGAHI